MSEPVLGFSRDVTEPRKTNSGVELILLVIIIYPVALLIGNLLAPLSTDYVQSSKYISLVVAIVLSFALGHFCDKISIPIRNWIRQSGLAGKLSPYFGSKLHETRDAFRSSKD